VAKSLRGNRHTSRVFRRARTVTVAPVVGAHLR
jgi:hypothetical protein